MTRSEPDMGFQARIKSAQLASEAMLARLNAVFLEHAKRTGRSPEWCRLHLVNGVMPS